MNGHILLMSTASHLFAERISCRSAKSTTGDYECIVRLKKFTLEKGEKNIFQEIVNNGYLHLYSAFVHAT